MVFFTEAIPLLATGNALFWFMFPLGVIFWRITKDVFLAITSLLLLSGMFLNWNDIIQVNPFVMGVSLLAFVIYLFYYFTK